MTQASNLKELTEIREHNRSSLEGLSNVAGTALGHKLTYRDSMTVRQVLVKRYKPSTVNKMLSALRGVLKQAWRLALLDADAYHRAADVENVRASTLLDAGEDVLTVQRLAGHAGVTTTARYDRRGEGAKRRAVRSLAIPCLA